MRRYLLGSVELLSSFTKKDMQEWDITYRTNGVSRHVFRDPTSASATELLGVWPTARGLAESRYICRYKGAPRRFKSSLLRLAIHRAAAYADVSMPCAPELGIEQ